MANRSSENEKELDVKLEWVPVQGTDGKPYLYRDDHKRLRKAWSKPAVYRWLLSGQKRTLVGESGNLYERLQAYVGSGHGRHVEIREVFDEELKSGRSVELEVLKFKRFTINGSCSMRIAFIPSSSAASWKTSAVSSFSKTVISC